AHALLEGSFSMELDGAAGSQHALPGERSRWRCAQQLGHLAVIERVTGGCCDLSVSGHFTARDLADNFAESDVAARVPGRAEQKTGGLARADGPVRTADHGR